MKRIGSMILTALIAAGLLVSCAGEAVDGNSTGETSQQDIVTDTTAADSEELYPAPETEDMDGAVLTILNYTPESFNWAKTVIFAPEITGEILEDALYSRESQVEEQYNCSIEELATGDVMGMINTSVAAGDKNFDTAMLFDANVSAQLTTGNLLSWNSLDIDFTLPWWDSAATEQYNFYGIQAAVSGAFSLYNYSTRHCYVFNNVILQNVASGTDLYDTVRDGKWTLDKMYEIAALAVADLNGDSAMKSGDDQYGIVSSVTRHYSAVLAGAGVKYIDRDESGNLYFTVPGNEGIQSVISKIVQLNVGNDIFTSGTNDIGGGAESTIFYDGRALFIAAYVGEVERMRGIDFDLGIVPSPKLNDTQEQYYSLIEGGAQSVVPKTLDGDDMHKTSVILDAFSYYSYKESIPAYIDIVLMMKVSRDNNSAEMLQLVFDTSFYDLGTGVWSSDTKNQFTKNIFLPRSDTVASLCATIEAPLVAKLDTFKEAVINMDK